MAQEVWQELRRQRCDRIDEVVALECRLVYPAQFLPDQPPRVLAHRCSKGLECNADDRPSCMWAGTLPGHDPFD
jgi:hypothetical protein